MVRAPKSSPAVPHQPAEPWDARRLRAMILSKAGAIVATEGLAAVQARRLAAEGDCSVGTLYNIFGDRDGLILAINRDTMTAMGHPLSAARKASAKSGLEARLLALGDGVYDVRAGKSEPLARRFRVPAARRRRSACRLRGRARPAAVAPGGDDRRGRRPTRTSDAPPPARSSAPPTGSCIWPSTTASPTSIHAMSSATSVSL